MNHRLTVTAAAAVILASVSMFSVFQGAAWLYAGIGAVITVAVAGTLTRLSVLPAAVAATVLALIACVPLLAGPAWYLRATGLVILAGTAASVTRRRILPAFAGIVTYLAALLIYLNAVYAGRQSAAAIVPTARSLHHLWLLAAHGLAERALSPPVPVSHGIALMTAGGIGLMAAATDLLAVRLRSPAMAGLPLLILFSVPIATNARETYPGGPLAFCLAVTGYLALLAADGRERLRIWGRLVTVWQTTGDDEPVRGPDTKALAASGRRVGLAAVSLAIVVPLVLPGLPVHGIFGKHPVPGADGSTVTLPEPLVMMARQLALGGNRTVLIYRTNNPDASTQYLPVYVLDYDIGSGLFKLLPPTVGATVAVESHHALSRIPGLNTAVTPVATYRTTITMGALTSGFGSKVTFLPVPYAPAAIKITGDWQEDDATLMVFSGPQKLAGLQYTVTSTDPCPEGCQLDSEQQPPAGIRNGYLDFSSPDKTALRKIARHITKGASTPYERALALEKYFLKPGNFTYNLNTNVPNSPAGLYDFLTKDKTGFCQQFAYAMAILARLVGIPSRIVVGYTAGTHQQRSNTWKVTTGDAHAWPELYFPTAGWLRFEPTPSGSAGQSTATQPPYVDAATSPVLTAPPPTGTSTAGHGRTPHAGAGGGGVKVHPYYAGGAPAGSLQGAGDTAFLVALILAIVLGLAAIAPCAARSLTRRRRWHTAAGAAGLAHAAWRELRDDLDDYGLSCRASESPRAVARRIAAAPGLGDSACQALNRIARAEERASYAVTPETAGALGSDVLTVRRAVARTMSRTVRWRARLLPSSTLRPLRAGLQHSLDVFGWLDAAGQKVRSRVESEIASRHEA